METARTVRAFRLAEASLILWFFLTALRAVVATLLALTTGALADNLVNLNFVNAHLLVAGAVALSWFAPGRRGRLPTTLGVSALVVAVARVPMTLTQPTVRFYAALIVFAFGGVYVASLVRASYPSFLIALITALTLDQLARAAGYTYDVTLQQQVWLLPQLGISGVAVAVSRAARARAKQELYEPAGLSLWNGLSLGALLFLEMALLGVPNVIARWAGVEYASVAGWLALATSLTLGAGVRHLASRPLEIFDERTRGWVWILLLSLLIVLGNRTGGTIAAVALVVAQVIVLMIVWWIPEPVPVRQAESEATGQRVGPAITFALAFYVVLSYVYLLIFEDSHVFLPLEGQALTLHLIAAVILGAVLVGWRNPDPWKSAPGEHWQHGLPFAFAIVAFILAVIAVRPLPPGPIDDDASLRVATFDIHYGYNPDWRYDLELTASFIRISGVDVVALQRVDTGRQVSYGADQVLWLSRRLGMTHVYQPTIERLTGVAVLSRWPVEDVRGELLASSGEQMGVAYALVARTPGAGGVAVYSTRLSPEIGERLSQVGALLGTVGNATQVVMAGSLNVATGDDTYNQLGAGNLSDANAQLNIVQDFTYPASSPTQRLDYVFLRGLMPLESQKVCGPTPASDHCLVVVELMSP